jgi:hypothetical protein
MRLPAGHIVALAVVGSANAAVSTFNARTTWTLAAGVNAFATEGFETSTPGQIGPSTFGSGLGFASTSLYAAIESSWPGNWGMQNTTPGGANYLHVGDGGGTTAGPAFTMTFNLPVLSTAFGFDVSGFQYPPLLTTIMRGGDVVGSFTLAEGVNFEPAFAGFVSSESFDRIVISTQPNWGWDDFALDQLSWAVPAPGAMGLLALTGLSRSRRR